MLNDVTPRPNENEQLAGNYRALPVTLCGLGRSVVHPRYALGALQVISYPDLT